jgi:hypothetical protein
MLDLPPAMPAGREPGPFSVRHGVHEESDWRRGEIPVRVATDPRDPAIGEPVRVVVDRSAFDDVDVLEMRLRCTLSRQDDEHVQTITAFKTEWAVVPDRADAAVEVDVPAGAPFSYEGESFRCAWEIQVRRRRRRGTAGRHFNSSHPLWVLPGRPDPGLPSGAGPESGGGRSLSIVVAGPRRRFVPGDVIAGVVRVERTLSTRGLDLALHLHERCGESSGFVTASEERLASGELMAGTPIPFRMRLPDDAVPSHESRWCTLTWEVRAQLRRRLILDIATAAVVVTGS